MMYSAAISVSDGTPYLRAVLVTGGGLFAITFLTRFVYAFCRSEVNLYSTVRAICTGLPFLACWAVILLAIVPHYGAPAANHRALSTRPIEHLFDTVQSAFPLQVLLAIGFVILYMVSLATAVWLGHFVGSVAALPIEVFRNWCHKRTEQPGGVNASTVPCAHLIGPTSRKEPLIAQRHTIHEEDAP